MCVYVCVYVCMYVCVGGGGGGGGREEGGRGWERRTLAKLWPIYDSYLCTYILCSLIE